MPTGYTAPVKDGEITSARDYILSCARAFGATIHQRDDPPDDPPSKLNIEDSYRVKALASAKQRLAEAEEMTIEEAEAGERKEREASVAYRDKYLADQKVEKQRYVDMAVAVSKWEPPTDEHMGVKKFALEQLEESIKFDCGRFYVPAVLEPRTPEQYKQRKIADAKENVQYHEEGLANEKERVESQNAWIDSLYSSVEGL